MIPNFKIRQDSSVTATAQIIEHIVRHTDAGKLKLGQAMPSVRDAANRWKIHYSTVSRAYKQLVEMQILEQRDKNGFYVSANAKSKTVEQLEKKFDKAIFGLFALARESGLTHHNVTKRYNEILADIEKR
jgi:DNA-binding transcriptional regulator YhcF (GntR family)